MIPNGQTCTKREGNVSEHCVHSNNSLCFDCGEELYTLIDMCLDCCGARRCVNNASHLLCGDGDVLVGSQCENSTEHDTLYISKNHVMRCSAGFFASGETCGKCPPSCISCVNGSFCSICAVGTSLSSDGNCVVLVRSTTMAFVSGVPTGSFPVKRESASVSTLPHLTDRM